MSELNLEQRREINSAFREIYINFAEKTRELFRLYEQGISGIESRVINPAYGINGHGNERKYLDDFPSFYQIEGVQFLIDNKRALIADEMGVGKTAQAIAGKIALENKLGKKIKTLVICPNKKVKKMWAERLEEYLTQKRYNSMKIENVEDYDTAVIQEADIVLIDYHSLSFSEKKDNNFSRKKLKKKLMDAGFNYVVLDEVHNVKNYSSASRFAHVSEIASNSEYLCLLSGTSMPNSPRDSYALVALLKPEHIDERGEKAGYKNANAVAEAHAKTPSVIGAILRASTLERKLQDVTTLPSKTEEYIHIDNLSSEQQEVYNAIYEDDSILGLQKIQKLKQALLNPSIISTSLKGVPKAKYEALDKIIQDAIANGEKVVIYSPNFRKGVVDFLEERYAHLGARHLDGKNNSSHSSIIKQFQKNTDTRIIVMNDVGGEGISLTAANTLVFLEEPYSPGERKQVIGRLWRLGQKKPVRILTLNVRGTIDDGLIDFLTKKKEAIEYYWKGVPLTEEQRKLVSGDDREALEKWLSINRNYLYTAAQKRLLLMARTREKPEDKVVKSLEGRFGMQLAESISGSWHSSILENSSLVYASIIKGIEKKERRELKIIDIASGFGALSYALKRNGICNVDADPHNFASPLASKENVNLVGRMTNLPVEEGGTFDLALCSMALDILPNTQDEPARARAVAEANRVLKLGGHYIITLPANIIPDEEQNLVSGFSSLGFEPIPELTGFVRSTDERINSNIYVLSAQKMIDAPKEINFVSLTNLFKLNDKEKARAKGTAQRRIGRATGFNFIRTGSEEELQYAIQRFVNK